MLSPRASDVLKAQLIVDIQRGIFMKATSATNRSFGLLIAGVLAVAGIWHYWARGADYISWLGAAAFFVAIAIVMPRILHPLKRLWLKLGAVLQIVMSPILLALIFVFSVLTTGLVVRLLRKDVLALKHDPAAASYWVKRANPALSPDSLKNQY
jgi:hypothetical protein